MATTTPDLIRDRMIAVIEALVPPSMSGDRFRVWRDELEADFKPRASALGAGALRRFQVRSTGESVPAQVSNMDAEQHSVTFEVMVAYPQTHRYGDEAARDRDRVITDDFHKIDFAVGMCGRANFPAGSAYDACWVGMQRDANDREGPVDFLVCRFTYLYYLARS